MNVWIFLLLGLLVVPFIPAMVELLRRRDKGPRKLPEQTSYVDRSDFNRPMLEEKEIRARAEVSNQVFRVEGDASIPDGLKISTHLVVKGNLRLGKKCRILGSVKALGNVDIGEHSVIEGNVLSEGKIRVGRYGVIKGIVDSPKEITIEENAIVEAVPTEGRVKLRSGAQIKRRVLSSGSIAASLFQEPKAGASEMIQQEAPAKSENEQTRALVPAYEVDQSKLRKAEELERELPPADELLERLIASKMREELKKKIKTSRKQSSEEIQRP